MLYMSRKVSHTECFFVHTADLFQFAYRLTHSGSQFLSSKLFALQLIVATPKSLLRLPEARSSFDDMIEGSGFQRVIPESGPASESSKDVKKLLFCSGKIYYELIKEREKINRVNDVAITRIEQVRMGYCGASCA